MFVVFEFLDNEPLDNVITSLNFKVDKTVYFGYADTISKYRNNLTGFLRKHCGNQEAEFIVVPRNKLEDTISIMRDAIKKEQKGDNTIFFDVTGGEEIPLVAFGILSTELDTPIHVFNVEKNKLREQEEGAEEEISKLVPRRSVEFDIDAHIELLGGSIKTDSRKKSKLLDDEESIREARRIIDLFRKHTGDWTRLINAFCRSICDDGDGYYHVDYNKTADLYYPHMATMLKSFLSEMAGSGIIKMFGSESGEEQFAFSSESVQCNMLEEGAALELMTCLELREKYKYAQAGVAVDWDGISDSDSDVANEVDVIALDGFIPVIVSCKCGNQANKDALYELDTVAGRFGGKYAKKIMVSAKNMMPADIERANEMGIELRIINRNTIVKHYC